MQRSPDLRRTVLFVAGADAAAQAEALAARPDVLVQDLEDFTPAPLKAAARARSAGLCAEARARAIVPAVRVNALDEGGLEDLAAVVAPAGPALVLLPKAERAAQVAALGAELERLERARGLAPGSLEIVPNAETAAGVVNLRELVQVSPRVCSCLLGSEDLAADLQAERGADALELAHARARFLLEARAFAIEPIDAPYTYSDAEGCAREAHLARRLGYRSKAVVVPAHVTVVQAVLTPNDDEIAAARRIVAAFERARAEAQDRALVDGQWIEPPTWRNAQRLLERARRLAELGTD